MGDVLQRLVDAFDVVKHLLPSQFLFRGSHEVRRKLFPLFLQFLQVVLHVFAQLGCAQLVRFGEDDGEGHAVFAQPFDELQVYLLRLVAAVDEDKQASERLAPEYVFGNDFLNLFLGRFAAFCISVTGQVHQIPFFVDEKMVDEERFARCGRCHGQLRVAGEHVDEARLAHVRTSDEGVFGQPVVRAFLHLRIAYFEFCVLDVHRAVCFFA